MKKNAHSRLFKLSLVALLLAGVVVFLGAYTRLVHAGLGCPDWPTCYGHIWIPDSIAEIARANQNYADTPVETDKTWPEQIHRIFASSLGFLLLVLFGVALKHRHPQQAVTSVALLLLALVGATISRIFIGDSLDPLLLLLAVVYFANLGRLARTEPPIAEAVPFKLSALLAGIVVLQGLFGMWTVTLKLWPQVVMAHLLGGFTTLSLTWLMIQRLGGFGWTLSAKLSAACLRLRFIAMLALVLVAMQIALGGWTSANYAALACPDFPLCQQQFFPAVNFSQGFNFFQQIGPNYLGGQLDNEGRTAIHIAHRTGALIVSITLVILALRLWQLRIRQAKNLCYGVLLLLLVQVILGICNIVFSLPLAIAVAHNAVGALLLMMLVMVNHRLRTVQTH